MKYNLNNGYYSVTVNSQGAELTSFIDKETQREYLWQADPKFWGRHAPILFPFVGRLNQDQYKLGDQIYHHSQHGFARDCDFYCLEQQNNFIRFRLNSQENTLNVYPFKFSLTINYELINNTLKIDYIVENQDSEIMPFSIGGHPGFNCPIYPETKFNQYYLEFSHSEKLSRYYLDQGLFNGQTEQILNNQNRLQLDHKLFEDDAIVFKHPHSKTVTLAHRDQGEIVKIHFADFEYLGIWTKPDPEANFICIEPWLGIADSTGFQGDFKDKEGIKLLAPKQSFRCSYGIEIC